VDKNHAPSLLFDSIMHRMRSQTFFFVTEEFPLAALVFVLARSELYVVNMRRSPGLPISKRPDIAMFYD
jgi:hypothetical protein